MKISRIHIIYTMLQLIPFSFFYSCYFYYYFYYLYQNSIFFKKFINFIFISIVVIIVLILSLIIFATEAYAQSPDFDLVETFLEKKTNFYNDKLLFDTKANNFSSWFNDRIAQVEFTKGRPMPQFKYMAESREQNDALEDFLMKRMTVEGKEIHNEACRMLDRVSELEAMDAKIHSLTQTNFDNSEYQKLTLHFFQYRDSSGAVRWYAIKHPNKIIKGMNLKNRYF